MADAQPGRDVPPDASTLGVVTIHRPDRPIADLPSVYGLVGQVDELLVVRNGPESDASGLQETRKIVVTSFDTNRGTAAAWNAALSTASDRGHRYLYLLDQDSVPSGPAGGTPGGEIRGGGPAAAAVVQPARPDRLGLDPFPWNTVASGSLWAVDALTDAGGFDERLFVDDVDREALARLAAAGREVRALPRPTIAHTVGSPRSIRFLGREATTSGHDAGRRWLQGFSAGLLVRRRAHGSARLLMRPLLTAAKDVAGGERAAARALLSGLLAGVATGRPPAKAAERACPYCEGPLVGRFGGVVDWRFGAGPPADVYLCPGCGALAAGRVPSPEEVASWYAEYYTHAVEPVRARLWSPLWPTETRRREQEQLRWYLARPGSGGRFLEVGTGTGERLVQFAAAGWDVAGQDLDPRAGHAARERGIPVHHCPVEELAEHEAPFDLVGLSHVLEHATDQGGLLRSCAALLTPAGRICVISPNARSFGRRMFGRWWFGLEQPRHLAIPTLDSLQRLSSCLGLETVHAEASAANGAVILGGSLDRWFRRRLPPGRLCRGVQFAMAALGQAMGRAASWVDADLGEEVVWLGRHRPS